MSSLLAVSCLPVKLYLIKGKGMLRKSNLRLAVVDERDDALNSCENPSLTQAYPPVRNAIFTARQWLLRQQAAVGCWAGRTESSVTHASQYLLLLAWSGQLESHATSGFAQYLLDKQLRDGGWPLYPGGSLDISASVQAYLALKLTGHQPSVEPLQRAREAILQNGGADAVDSITRDWLSLFAQIPLAAASGELVPLDLLRAGIVQINLRQGVRELFHESPCRWPPCHNRQPSLHSLRTPFLRAICEILGLRCQGASPENPALISAWGLIDELIVEENPHRWPQPGRGAHADTALCLRALLEAGVESSDEAIATAMQWLDTQISEAAAIYCSDELAAYVLAHQRRLAPAATLYDIPLPGLRLAFGDDDACDNNFADSALQTLEQLGAFALNVERKLRSRQNLDGGWSGGDALNQKSQPDATAHVLAALGTLGYCVGDAAIDRAITYLREVQQADGSWRGDCGVCYIYGTAQVLWGLSAVGILPEDSLFSAGTHWLLAYQQACGGWGESPASSSNSRLRGQGPVTASQTAWALLALLAAGLAADPAVLRGVRYLVGAQDEEGAWHEPEFLRPCLESGTFQRNDLDRVAYPLLALSQFVHQTQ